MESLPIFLKLDNRPVILLGDGEAAEAKRRLLARANAIILRDEHAEAALAVVAIEDENEAIAVSKRLKERGILVNAVDRPGLCDFMMPAIVDRSPILIAIGTGGASASLAKALRQWLERMLPASLGRVAEALLGARASLATHVPVPAERRAFLDRLLTPGAVLDPLANHDDPAALIAAALKEPPGDARPRLDEIVLHGIDPDELTLRAARLLAEADTVLHHPLVPPAILDRARADAARIACEAPPSKLPPGRTVFVRMRKR